MYSPSPVQSCPGSVRCSCAMEECGQYYRDYLGLDQLLSAQKPLSLAHDEMLFIVAHQTYELWFKQILHELDSCICLFARPALAASDRLVVVSRLRRIVEIQRVLVSQLRVLETMTPLDFLDFRKLLTPASGFQSLQFRSLEAKLGLKREQRLKFNQAEFCSYLDSTDRAAMRKIEECASLAGLVEKWLERTPFLETHVRIGFVFC